LRCLQIRHIANTIEVKRVTGRFREAPAANR
jgi:hypothetical protein